MHLRWCLVGACGAFGLVVWVCIAIRWWLRGLVSCCTGSGDRQAPPLASEKPGHYKSDGGVVASRGQLRKYAREGAREFARVVLCISVTEGTWRPGPGHPLGRNIRIPHFDSGMPLTGLTELTSVTKSSRHHVNPSTSEPKLVSIPDILVCPQLDIRLSYISPTRQPPFTPSTPKLKSLVSKQSLNTNAVSPDRKIDYPRISSRKQTPPNLE